jgi:hypothetical protein
MAHQLVFNSETGKSRAYPVAGERISIGRHPQNTVVLDHEFVSIYHAEVVVERGKTLLRDLKSSNGTKVNRKRIAEATLAEGDEIRFGPIVCHYRREKASETVPVAPKSAAAKDAAPSDVAARDAAPKSVPGKSIAPQPGKQPAPEESRTFLQKLQFNLAESRYFMLSLVIHSIIVILAGTIVFYKAVLEPPDFVAEGGDGLISSTDDLAPPPETPADSVPTEKVVVQTPNITAPTIDVITTAAPPTNFKVAVPQVQVRMASSSASLARAMAGMSRGFTGSLPGAMGGRIGSGRAKAMAQNGMKAKSEQAVINGLIWLMQNQNADGSWGESNKGAMTGFGLLCFLGHGETPASPFCGITVRNAVQWILDNGTKNEGRLNMASSFNQPGVYEHAICAYALGEYYTMTKDRRVVELLKQAVGHIIEGQSSSGGWMYSYDKSADDLSVSGWQIQALKAAHLSQIKISGIDPALDKAIKYIDRVKGPKGGYGYREAADDYSLTGVGILCQLFWRADRGALRKGIEWMLDETENNKPVKYRENSADLYAWYYHTQACLMFGGDAWKKWNAWFQDEICDVQNPDGSWPIPGGRTFGPQSQDNMTGAVYRTALCILMLEVFYRYMPTTQG